MSCRVFRIKISTPGDFFQSCGFKYHLVTPKFISPDPNSPAPYPQLQTCCWLNFCVCKVGILVLVCKNNSPSQQGHQYPNVQQGPTTIQLLWGEIILVIFVSFLLQPISGSCWLYFKIYPESCSSQHFHCYHLTPSQIIYFLGIWDSLLANLPACTFEGQQSIHHKQPLYKLCQFPSSEPSNDFHFLTLLNQSPADVINLISHNHHLQAQCALSTLASFCPERPAH